MDGAVVHYELVVNGFANIASFSLDIACIPTFRAAEQKARTGNLGIWNAPPTSASLPTLAPSIGGSSSGDAPVIAAVLILIVVILNPCICSNLLPLL
jgi:hypothetical protein